MQNSKNERRKTLLDSGGLLFFLLAFSLAGSLLPTVIGSSGTTVIGSSGAITYSSSAILLITDSTPEEPVPYKIDGISEYQTGSTYTISAGTHTIELPSPYTSPISNTTYYFSSWQDGSTDNPRTVTLDPDATTNLHGIYSISQNGTPPPPPPPPPGDGYFAYNGFESVALPAMEEGGGSFWWVQVGSNTKYRTTDRAYMGDYSLYLYKPYGSERLAFCKGLSNEGEIYLSYWIYIVGGNSAGWGTQFFEVREDHCSHTSTDGFSLNVFIINTNPWHWRICASHVPGGYSPPTHWSFVIDENHWARHYSDPGVYTPTEINEHGVPTDRWFRFELYLKYSTNGIFRVWLTDPENPDPSRRATRTLISMDNVPTAEPAPHPEYLTTPKLYGGEWEFYIDEMYWYDYNAHEE